jgi:two-component system sensor histidine kinase RegB
MVTPAAGSAHRINFSWLIRLRWGALVGQVATILVVERVLAIDVPLGPLAAVVAIEALINVAATLWLRSGRPVAEATMALTMALDIGILTALLFFTGGRRIRSASSIWCTSPLRRSCCP